mmetsp:Transcript_37/g.94  ORF Transcript_37/g.94 Transcript_37/m.94 type:complete len:811 (+) Transcript_37:190-2622(+)
MAPLPLPEQRSSLSESSTGADSISLLVKASTSIEDAGQSSSSSPLRDELRRQNSPLHQMTKEQDRRSHMEKMPAAQQTNDAGRRQLDASILSKMVTASGPGGAVPGMPNIRVASMQEFQRASMNSLNSGSPNQMLYAATSSSRQAPSMANSRRMTTDNPLLKMMEQRMASKNPAAAADETLSRAAPPTKKPPNMVGMTDQQRSSLNASINKWSGIGTHVAATSSLGKKCISTSQLKTVDERSTSMPSPSLEPASPQNEVVRRLSNESPGTQPRQPLNSSQEALLRELIQTQNSSSDNSYMQPTPTQSSSPIQESSTAEDFVAQMLLHQQQQQQQLLQQHQNRGAGMYAPVSQRGLARSAVSLAEIDRLRKANQSVQMRQQMAMQERIYQQCLLRPQRKPSSGDVRLAGSGLPNEMAMRKRRSSATLDENSSMSSRTPSTASNTSSNKIYRSDSHTHVSSSMENLRLSCSRPSSLNMHNHRFSSSGMNISNQSYSSGLNMQNSSLSSGLSRQNQSFSNGPGMRPTSSKVALKRSTSSSSWIQSMISTQESAGKAALVAATLSKDLEDHLLKPVKINSSSSSVKEEEDAIMKTVASAKTTVSPVQVTADEYSAPPLERGSSEIVIMSDLPDRIKFQNVQIDKKPIDVVKEALLSRGEDANIRPTVDMPADFFKQYDEMYAQEAVDAVRSNDVDTLRQLAADGKNLQCGNRFGETLIHLACRRSHQDVVEFLIKEAGVSIQVRDDFGRTPMHDACWRSTVDLELMDLLIDSCPELLMLSDKRGHTPLDYARREHWDVLIPYLMEKKDQFRPIN